MKNPCGKDCPNRQAGCHSACEAYAAFWEECEKARKRRAMMASINSMGEGLRKNLVKKAARIRQQREK